MSQITRCPFCATTFKVVADQLRISDGWVRCGQCKEVFDASEHLLHSEPGPLLPEQPLQDEHAPAQPAMRTPEGVHVWGSARGTAAPAASEEPLPPPDGADESAQHPAAAAEDENEDGRAGDFDPAGDTQALTPLSALLKREALPEPQDGTEPSFQEMPGYELTGASHGDSTWPQDAMDDTSAEPAASDEPAEQLFALQGLESLSSEPIPADEAVVLPVEALLDGAQADVAVPAAEPGFVTAARRGAFWRRPWVRGVLALAGLCLVLALGLQLAVQERDAIAARNPAAQALMERLCQALQCTLQAPRHIDAVVIDSSSFVKARHDAAAYELQVGIKNKSAHTVAMPALELTLTDAHEQMLLRRVLLRDELGAPAQLAPGATWSATVPVQVMQDASLVAGYRLLAFYP